ncbi:MAG: GFA family protein [Hyphomicrobium sp.]|jgi:hypothetical protein
MTAPFARGRCLCGAVSYVIKAKPVRMVQCHCKDCQRSSGTGHISNALFRQEDVEISGATSSYAVMADSGNTLTRHFCPVCGGRVYNFTTARAGLISVTVGTLDDNSWFSPDAVLYIKRRADWDITRMDVPNFEAMPPPVR